MPKSAELDPLLPNNEPAPEISGYGYSRNTYAEPKYSYATTPTYFEQRQPEYVNNEVAEDGDDDDGAEPDTRKRALSTLISMFTVVVFFAFVATLLSPSKETPPEGIPIPDRPHTGQTIEGRVRDILIQTPLIDGHNDLAIYLREAYKNDIHSSSFKEQFEYGNMSLNVDLPRLRKGMVGGAFWSAFVICPANASTDFSDENYAVEVSHTLQQIDLIKRVQRMYPAWFSPAGTSRAEMLVRFHATRSLFGMISIEGLHQLSQSAAMSTLRLYYELGVRAATLTWNCHNAFADAALVMNSFDKPPQISGPHRGGLTARGRAVVREMNRLGMLIDISHTSYWTQKAVLSNATSLAPVIYSHSSAYALCPHPRNVQDDILDLVKSTRSLVMVNFSPDFISCTAPSSNDPARDLPVFYPANNTLHQVARHITYIGRKIGWEFVGLGSDYDGMGKLTPKGLEGVDKFPDLLAELLRMGVADNDVKKVVGGNLLRVWREAEEVSSKMQLDGVREGEDEVFGY